MKSIRYLPTVVLVVVLGLSHGCRPGAARHFGEPFTVTTVTALEHLNSNPESYYRQPLRIAGTITRQCPASGCWFFLQDAQGHALKIELGDTLPELPQRVGHRAEVEGELIKHGDASLFIGTRVTFYARE